MRAIHCYYFGYVYQILVHPEDHGIAVHQCINRICATDFAGCAIMLMGDGRGVDFQKWQV